MPNYYINKFAGDETFIYSNFRHKILKTIMLQLYDDQRFSRRRKKYVYNNNFVIFLNLKILCDYKLSKPFRIKYNE